MATWYYLYKAMKNKSLNKSKKAMDNYYADLPHQYSSVKNEDSSLCRICLQSGSVDIYNCEDCSDIVHYLNLISDIDINENDIYPKQLCIMCYTFVKTAIMFKNTAKRSDEILRRPPKEECTLDPIQFSQNDHDYSDTGPSESRYEDPWSDLDDIPNKVKEEKKEKVKYPTKVTCHICDKVINRSYYKEHVTMHDPDHKKYVCDVCGKSFRLRCAYHNHSLRHRTDFPYKCKFCPYRGRYAELLKTHMRTHTGDYRYMCTECPARFLFKSNLNSHMLKHKEPQFKCDTCKRAFHTTLALQRHFEADHLGIKNHVCNICGKAFGYRNAMMKHQRRVHKRKKISFGRMPSYLEAENKTHIEKL